MHAMPCNALVRRVITLTDYPALGRRSIILTGGITCVLTKQAAARRPRPPDKVDDLLVHVAVGMFLPEWLLRQLGLWDAEAGRGTLGGAAGDRVKATRLRALLIPVRTYAVSDRSIPPYRTRWEEFSVLSPPLETISLLATERGYQAVLDGDDVTATLGLRTSADAPDAVVAQW